PGFCHTVVPLFERGLLVVSDEATKDGGKDWPKLVWIGDARQEGKLVPISTCPLPTLNTFANWRGRFDAHNLYDNDTGLWYSACYVVGTFFNGGLRAFALADPFHPREAAWFVPPAPRKSPSKAIQINDVMIDERGITYAVDRMIGGLYVLEMKL